MAEVVLENLGFCYPGVTEATLENLNLSISSGEAHALLGGSGAGKSTLLNLLSGLLPMQRGHLRINGIDVAGVAAAERGVSQVFQFPVLYEAMSVRENLAFPLKTRGVSRAARVSRVRELAVHLQIDHLLERRPESLSLFEKQIVAIAKALIRPDVALVLLDEPLTAAEPARKWQLRRSLKALQKESGATMIYVTHDQTEALTFADRISVLHEGRIVQTGTPEQLVDKPLHEHVGFFVGTPGMNFLDGEVSGGACRVSQVTLSPTGVAAGPCRVGFRPDWAQLRMAGEQVADDSGGSLTARISSLRVLGTHRGAPFGLVQAEVAGISVTTRQALDGLMPGPASLALERVLTFRDGWLVDA